MTLDRSSGLVNLVTFPSLFYLVLAVPYTILLVWLMPPVQVADEGHHYLRAVAISDGEILPYTPVGRGSGGDIEDSAAAFMQAYLQLPFRPDSKIARSDLQVGDTLGFGGSRSFHEFPAATVYPPYTYAAPAVAIAFARSAGLSQLDGLHLARLANAALVLLSASLAIAWVPVGKWSVTAICLLPMFVAQAAGVTSDGVVFACSLVALALLARGAASQHVKPQALLAVAGLIAAAAAIRVPMVALVLALLTVGWLRLPFDRARRAAILTVVAVVAVAPAIGWLAFAIPDQVDSRLFNMGDIDPGRQLSFVLHNPGGVVRIAYDTLTTYSAYYGMQFIGVLGYLDTPLRGPLASPYVALPILIVGVFLIELTLREHLAKRVAAAFLLCVVVTSSLIFASLYLGWTPVGYGLVEGVQGRYFIPVVAMLVVALSGATVGPRDWRGYALPSLVFLVFCYSAPITIWSLVDRYYLR